MNQQWVIRERQLWDSMQDPGRGRKRVTLHSITPDDPKRRKQVLEKIEKQKELDFSLGWRAYEDWMKH